MPSSLSQFTESLVLLASLGSLQLLVQQPLLGQQFPTQHVPDSSPQQVTGPPSSQTPASGDPGQQLSGPGYRLTVTTRAVVLDVVVTDKHGVLMHRDDLTKDDFTIYENKVPQKILSFEAPEKHALPINTEPVVTSAADLKKIGDAPVTILVLDELNSQFQDMSFARQMMIKYLQAQTPVLKQPTILMIAMNTKFIQVHDYTQNRDELIDVVKKHMPEYPWRMMNSGKGGPGAVERMAQVLAALTQLAQSSKGTSGRKNVIWVGNGFPSINIGTLAQADINLIEAAVRRTTAKLLASRITMYTINPMAGSSATVDIETPNDLDTTAADASDLDPFGSGTISFTDFASDTGGTSFQGRNDINNVIAEGVKHGEEYYTVSYSPSDKTTDPTRYRDIVIVMKDPNLRATTRKGYFPDTGADVNGLVDTSTTPQQKQRGLELDISQALTSTISYNGLIVTANKGKDGDYTIQVMSKNLSWSEPTDDGLQHSEATVAAAWYDSKGKLISHVAREETYPRNPANTGAIFTLPVPKLPASVAKIRFVVRDALSGAMGTVDLTNK